MHALAATLAPRAAHACTVCGCGDPVLSVQGTDAPEQRDLRLGLESRVQERTVGDVPASRARGVELRTQLGVAYTPSRWVSLVAQAPWVYHRSEAPNLAAVSTSSLGDAELQARVHVYRDRRWLARHALSVTAALELPTAPEVTRANGLAVAPDEQPGSGSWDVSLGLSYVFRASSFTLYASALARWDSLGWHAYQRGASLRASVLPLWRVDRYVALAPALDLRATLADTQAGATMPDTGGLFVYASPTALFGDAEVLLLRVSVQVPVVAAALGAQRESPAFLLGVSRAIF